MSGAPDLGLDVLGIGAGAGAAAPALRLRVGLRRLDGGPVQCVLLTATATVAAAPEDGGGAGGEPRTGAPGTRGRSPHGPARARAGATVPTFRGRTEVTLSLPCGRDVRALVDRRLRALRGGDVPLDLTFDGTVFYPDEEGTPHTAHAAWHHEAAGALPARAWRDLADRHEPAARWLRLDDACFGRLAAYRVRRAHTSFDDTVDELLRHAEAARREEWTA